MKRNMFLYFSLILLFSCEKKDKITYIDISGKDINMKSVSEYLVEDYSKLYPVDFEYVKSLDSSVVTSKGLGDLSFISNLESLSCLRDINLRHLDGARLPQSIENIWIVNNPIEYISSLENLNNLKSLGITYGWLNKIEGLDNLKQLVELDLSANSIEVIEGLEGLESLKKISVANNKIRDYSGLLVLKNMKEISIVGSNHIRDEKSRKILKEVVKNNPEANLYGFEWLEDGYVEPESVDFETQAQQSYEESIQ